MKTSATVYQVSILEAIVKPQSQSLFIRGFNRSLRRRIRVDQLKPGPKATSPVLCGGGPDINPFDYKLLSVL